MRVAHVITRMILGGAQESTLYLCDALRREHGIDAVVITGPPLGPEGELLSEAARRAVPCFVVPELRRAVNPYYDARAFVRLAALLRRLRPDVVHTHSSKAGILGRFAARAACVPAVLHTIRGLPFHPYASPVANAVFIAAERAAALVTDHYSCVARAMVDGALAAGVGSPDRMTVIRTGISLADYEDAAALRRPVRERYGLSEHDLVVGKVARLFHLKGHEFLVRAAPRVVEACPNARFLLVGDGVLRRQLLSLAARLGVAERFVFTGLVPPADIPGLISAMDVLVHTSLREGLARVLVQALLCERPVVTYALDGAPEVIIDNVTGRLVPAESVDELADAVVRTLHHPAEARRMADEGRRRFADEFSVRRAASDTARLYQRLLAR